MNSKIKIAKKVLCLAFALDHQSAYPGTINIKTVNNPCDKEGYKNGKKGDKTKSKDKDNNNTGTIDAHVGEATTLQDSSNPSNGSSIGAHVSDVTKPDV